MAQQTEIAWCDSTFNPWIGCTKVSPGCAHCYAERDFDLRKHVAKWGPGQPRHRTSAANWAQPLKWDREAAAKQADLEIRRTAIGAVHGPEWTINRPRVFCASLADWLDDEVPIEWLADLLDLIRRTPNLNWLLLTKRPGNFAARMLAAGDRASLFDWVKGWMCGYAPSNVWIGTTVEDQARADERIPALLKIPARVRFLSVEPMLGPVVLGPRAMAGAGTFRQMEGIHWVICGGESGPKARPMHPDWARSLRDQCAAAGVPFLLKQWGEWADPDAAGFEVQTCRGPDGQTAASLNGSKAARCANGLYRVGKHAAGRALDNCCYDGFPEVHS